jgi:hypothetical protein
MMMWYQAMTWSLRLLLLLLAAPAAHCTAAAAAVATVGLLNCRMALLLLLLAAVSVGSTLLRDLAAPASPCRSPRHTAPAAAMLLLHLLQGCLLLYALRCAAHLQRHLCNKLMETDKLFSRAKSHYAREQHRPLASALVMVKQLACPRLLESQE